MTVDELGAAERRDLKASFHREWRRNEELRAENERIKSELVSDALLPKLFAERDELRAEVDRLRAELDGTRDECLRAQRRADNIDRMLKAEQMSSGAENERIWKLYEDVRAAHDAHMTRQTCPICGASENA